MTVRARLAAFAAGLAVAFWLGAALGASFGPEPTPAHTRDATDAPHSSMEDG